MMSVVYRGTLFYSRGTLLYLPELQLSETVVNNLNRLTIYFSVGKTPRNHILRDAPKNGDLSVL